MWSWPTIARLRASGCALLVLLAASAVGCATPPKLVSVPSSGAVTAIGEKDTGRVGFRNITDEGVAPTFLPFEREGTLAQSGEGLLGDRVFRENAHSLVEGCRWQSKGRVCELIMLPDGKYLGGGISWVVGSRKATPRASGWAAEGSFARTMFRANGESSLVAHVEPVITRIFHCRFSDAGPRCLQAALPKEAASFRLLAAMTVRDGEANHEVLWLGSQTPVAGTGGAFSAPDTIKDIYRCETTEESTEVSCKMATLR